MLARRSIITHPCAGAIELPLLVPAFSSKGFRLKQTRRARTTHDFSEVVYELMDFGARPSSSVMVSAYDLYFGHFDAPEQSSPKPETYLRNSRLVFLDSGGYELVPDIDSSGPKAYAYTPKTGFGPGEYEGVLQRLAGLSKPLPLVIANFDHGTRGEPLRTQIKSARGLFKRFPDCTSDFIIKPWTPQGRIIEPSQMTETDFANLRGFDIIGVTEKELGRDIFERIKRIAKLRRGLDDAKFSGPIHIWGGLDPIMTPLYFFVGAEIFDGVSWLRYAFHNGIAINREIYAIVSQIGVTASGLLNHAYASLDNLTALNNLTIALQQWVDFEGKRFDMFHPVVRDHLDRAYNVMVSRIAEIDGGV